MKIQTKSFEAIATIAGLEGDHRYQLATVLVRTQKDADESGEDYHVIWPLGSLYRTEAGELRLTNGDNFRAVPADDAAALEHPYVLVSPWDMSDDEH